MIRLAVSPLLIAFGMALIAHLLSLIWADWVTCFEDAAAQDSSPYWEYLSKLASHPAMAALSLATPFLPFMLVAPFFRAPERLFWQWIGIGTTIATLVFLISGVRSARTCPDDRIPAEFGIPELIPMVLGGATGCAVFLVVTYIGSVRHARRKVP